MTSTITLWSESGGVGKTTTTLNLAAALTNRDHDVLIVDLDPQPASITDHAGHTAAKTTDGPTLNDALLEADTTLADIRITQDSYDLIPAHESLANLEQITTQQNTRAPEFLLDQALTSIETEYDYILIDTPATLNRLVDNALIASNHVLIPMEMTRKGKQSVEGVLETIDSLTTELKRAKPDFELNILGVLANKVTDSTLNQTTRDELEAQGIPLLDMSIPDYNVLESAWNDQLDIYQYETEHGLQRYQQSIIDAYEALADHVETHTQPSTTEHQETEVTTA